MTILPIRRQQKCIASTDSRLISRLHKEVQDFLNWISPSTKESEVRAFVVKRVIDTIESAAPQCRAFAFGSFATKLYVPDACDLISAVLSIGILIWSSIGQDIHGQTRP